MKAKHENFLTLLIAFVLCFMTTLANAELVAHWKLDETSGNIAFDSSGKGYNGTIYGVPIWVKGKDNNALKFNGKDNYVDLPIGSVINSLTNSTFATWVNFDNTNNVWQRVFDFGSNTTVNMFLTPCAGGTRTMRFAITNRGNTAEEQVTSSGVLPSDWRHIALTIDADNGIASLYLDAKEVAKNTTMLLNPSILGETTQNWLGRSQYADDVYFDGSMDDFRIYDHAMNSNEVTELYFQYFVPSSHRLLQAVRDAKAALEEQNPKNAVDLIEQKVSEYEQWEKQNPNELKAIHKQLSCELYYLLAKAKEAANAPVAQVLEAYKKSISQLQYSKNYIPVTLLLLSNISAADYIDVVKKSAKNCDGIPENLHLVAKDFESSKNWAAFELFVDTVFSEVDDDNSFADAIAAGLNTEGLWYDNFSKYTQNKPEFAQFNIKVLDKYAEKKIYHYEFIEAAEIYKDILGLCYSSQDKEAYQLKVYECLFKGGKYNKALSELENLIKNNKTTDKSTIAKAMMLKGQILIQLNEISRACETYSTVMKEYPQISCAAEACFFIGYCKMIEGKFADAKESLNLVVKNYPQSPYMIKAQFCLSRIEKQ